MTKTNIAEKQERAVRWIRNNFACGLGERYTLGTLIIAYTAGMEAAEQEIPQADADLTGAKGMASKYEEQEK